MAYVVIAAGDVDAKSPLTDTLAGNIKGDLDHLKSALSDGAAASQVLEVSSVTVAGSGTALTVNNDATITGTLTVGNFTVLDTALLMMGW